MAASSSDYLLGTAPAEFERLGFQHQVWLAETTDLLNRAGFHHGQSLIDLGCGPGFATMDLLHRVGPSGRVTAVDNEGLYLDAVRTRAGQLGFDHLDLVQADARELELPARHHGALVRWLLCFLREPRAVLQRLVAALHPGGRIVVLDYYNYLSVSVQPPGSGCEEIFQTYYDSLQSLGGSFDVGGLVPKWLAELDCDVEQMVPLQRVGPPGSMVWDWVTQFNLSHWPVLKQRGLIDEQTHERFMALWNSAERRAGAFFVTPPMLGVIARKREP